MTDSGRRTETRANILTEQPFAQTVLVTEDRGIVLRIRNIYTQPITAFIMTVNPAGGDSPLGGEVRSYFDIFINYKQDSEIVPGAPYEVPVAQLVGVEKSALKPRIRAMVFSDGSTWGETAWISKILDMRGRASDELEAVKAILDSSTESDVTRADIATKLEIERRARRDRDRTSDIEMRLVDESLSFQRRRESLEDPH